MLIYLLNPKFLSDTINLKDYTKLRVILQAKETALKYIVFLIFFEIFFVSN